MRCSEDFLWDPARWGGWGRGGVAVARDHQGYLLSSSYWELWNIWKAMASGPRLRRREENDQQPEKVGRVGSPQPRRSPAGAIL